LLLVGVDWRGQLAARQAELACVARP
jgi:hypothetical protein